MNKKYVKASILWLSKLEGGRAVPPPTGTRYCPIIRIEGGAESDISWSADININDYESKTKCFVDLSYLSPEAPIDNLLKGKKFTLYEGAKLVAKGEVISE